MECVTPDVAFFEKDWKVLKTFLKKCVIPELLAKYFSAPKPAAAFANHGQQWCYCCEPEAGNMSVSGFCSVRKFHLACLHMKRILNSRYVPAAEKASVQ